MFAYSEISNIIIELNAISEEEKLLHEWYQQAETLAKEANIVPSIPRMAQCMSARIERMWNIVQWSSTIGELPLPLFHHYCSRGVSNSVKLNL